MTRPPRLLIDGEEIPCQDTTALFILHKVFRLKTSDESYSLVPALREIFWEMQISPSKVRIDCFANKANHQEKIYCTKENSLWRYNLSKLRQDDSEILWSNPPFSKMAEFVTKIALEPCKILVVHPD